MRDICADCGQIGPSWASVNRGILLCDDCCSVHRNLGRHVSIVKSLNNDLWSPSLLLMFETLCKAGANNVWEHTLLDHNNTSPARKPAPSDPIHPTKEEFIRAKHEHLEFVLHTDQEIDGLQGLGAQLHGAARTPDLLTSLRLFAQGADPNFYHEEKGSTPLHVAAKCNQLLQAELLIIYGADLDTKNSNGQTPEECARGVGHLALADRLNECRYHVIDRLARFLCSRKPGLVHQQYDYLPEFLNSLDQPESNQEATSKLQMLPNRLFEKLVADIYDEVNRREVEHVTSPSTLPPSSPTSRSFVPFLPVHPELSSTRNQGRQKLGRFTNKELCSLIYDVLRDAKRREAVSRGYKQGSFDSTPRSIQHSQLITNRLKSEISDEEPLYDSVASDEDYISAEKLAEITKQTKLDETREKIKEAELRQGLATSQATIDKLQSDVKLLQATIDGLLRENRELREEAMRGKSTPMVQQSTDLEDSTEFRSSKAARPTSMYETREGLKQKADPRPLGSTYVNSELPSTEEVIRLSDHVTKRIKALWTAMQECNHTTFYPCAKLIGSAVSDLTAIFPQYPPDELIRELMFNSARLRMDCSTLQEKLPLEKPECLQQIRNSAYSIAKATKLLVMKYGNISN